MIDQLPEIKQTEREAALPGMCCSLSRFAHSKGEWRRWKHEDTTVVEGDKMRVKFEGSSRVYYHPFSEGLGPCNSSCFGCPHLGVDSYGQTHCTAPLMVETYGCPQFMNGNGSLRSSGYCPMRMTNREKRIFRLGAKVREIFWEYYHERGKNPYHEGFRVC